MKACTFFGHSNCPSGIAPFLEETITKAILEDSATMFYVGNQGQFDSMARKALKRITLKYPQVNYAVVLAYMPNEKKECDYTDYSDTMLPEGIENVPPRFAISCATSGCLDKRILLSPISPIHGAVLLSFTNLAKRQHKQVINIADIVKGQA